MKIGFVGCGNMGEAMLRGIIDSKFAYAKDINIHSNTEKTMQYLKDKYGVNICVSNSEVAKLSQLVILAVKPNLYEKVISEIKQDIPESAIVLGITPAYTISAMEELIGRKDVKIARAMPNTPCLVSEGMTGVAFSDDFSEADKEYVKKLFQSFGDIIEIEENLMGAIGSLSGSSPAFIYMLIEAMGEAGIEMGFKAQDAYRISAKSVLGSAKMVLNTDEHPAKLRDNVCSAGGTTIAGVNIFEQNGFKGNIIEAMKASLKRFKELER